MEKEISGKTALLRQMSSDIAEHAALCRRVLEWCVALLTGGIVSMLIGVGHDARFVWISTILLCFGLLAALGCLAFSILVHERLLALGGEMDTILPDNENNNQQQS